MKWEEVLAEELAANEDVKKLWDSWTAFHEDLPGLGRPAAT